MAFYERTLSREDIFAGRVITVHRDKVELADGRTSFREVVDHHGGVGILALLPDGTVPMVRQFRYPFGREVLEIPAGKLEAGEDPADCARRELSEETGFIAEELIPLGKLLATPGYCSEQLYIFLAVNPKPGKAHLDPGEFLNVERIPFEKLLEMVDSGELEDGKTVTAILKASRKGLRPDSAEGSVRGTPPAL